MYKYTLLVGLSNKRQNDWTDRAQIFCGTSRDPREDLWMIEFSKICFNKLKIFENFENRNFYKLGELFLFYNVFKVKMFTTEIEGREAP